MQPKQKDNQAPSHQLEINMLKKFGAIFIHKPEPKQDIPNNITMPKHYKNYDFYASFNKTNKSQLILNSDKGSGLQQPRFSCDSSKIDIGSIRIKSPLISAGASILGSYASSNGSQTSGIDSKPNCWSSSNNSSKSTFTFGK